MWVHVMLRRGAVGCCARFAGGTPLSVASCSAECTSQGTTTLGCLRWRRPSTVPLGGIMFSGPVACLHGSAALTGVKKLPVDDDVLITRQQAKDLIYRLHQKERRILLEELELYKTLDNKASPAIHVNRPNAAQLRAICIHNALPFIGFGFLDNFIMICAGDYIDMTLGLTFGISTMAAAGLGNAISDVAGIGSAWYVERIAYRIGVHVPNLTPEQLDMTSTRIASNFGRAFGVFIGCIIGMCPLLFLDTTNKDSDNQDEDENNNDDKTANERDQQTNPTRDSRVDDNTNVKDPKHRGNPEKANATSSR